MYQINDNVSSLVLHVQINNKTYVWFFTSIIDISLSICYAFWVVIMPTNTPISAHNHCELHYGNSTCNFLCQPDTFAFTSRTYVATCGLTADTPTTHSTKGTPTRTWTRDNDWGNDSADSLTAYFPHSSVGSTNEKHAGHINYNKEFK